MKWSKNLILLGLGYAAGLLVALKFGKDGKDKSFAELADDAKSVHKNLWTETEAQIFSEENKRRVAELKDRAMTEIESFRVEAGAKMEEMKLRWMAKKEEVEAVLADLYGRRQEIIDRIMAEGKDITADAVSGGEDVTNRLQRKLSVLAKDLKRELERSYDNIKNKL